MDIALAVEQLIPDALFRRAATYAELTATWQDERAIPTYAELETAWEAILQAREDAVAIATERETNVAEVQQRFTLSTIKSKSPTQIYTYIENQIDGWTSLAEAKTDLKAWLPLLAAVMAWLVVEKD